MKRKTKEERVFGLSMFTFSAILGGLFVTATTSILIMLAFDFLTFQNQTYQSLTVKEAIRKIQTTPEILVILTDAKINCGNNIQYRTSKTNESTSVEIANSDKNIFILGVFSEDNCKDIGNKLLKGSFSKISPQSYFTATNKGINFGNHTSAENIYQLCNFCGPENTNFGIVVSSIVWLLSLVICYLLIKENYKKK